MRRGIVYLAAGLLLGGAAGPVASQADSPTLEQRVTALEVQVTDLQEKTEALRIRMDLACSEFRLWKPLLWTHLANRGAC